MDLKSFSQSNINNVKETHLRNKIKVEKSETPNRKNKIRLTLPDRACLPFHET